MLFLNRSPLKKGIGMEQIIICFVLLILSFLIQIIKTWFLSYNLIKSLSVHQQQIKNTVINMNVFGVVEMQSEINRIDPAILKSLKTIVSIIKMVLFKGRIVFYIMLILFCSFHLIKFGFLKGKDFEKVYSIKIEINRKLPPYSGLIK